MERFAAMNEERMIELDKPEVQITKLVEGLKFGDGSISSEGENPDVLVVVDEIVESPEILVAVDVDDDGDTIKDDGCGDGRGVKFVFKLNETLKRSLNRAKVFGGGAAMGAASLIGLGRAKNKPLQSVFDDSLELLQTQEMDFGAHTDDHAPEDSSGCGAIDKAPAAILAAVRYEEPIRGVIAALGVNTEGLDEVYDNYRDYAAELPKQPQYSGKKVMERIIKLGKIVKQLEGPHKERRIILNTVRGYTVNQKLVRERTNDAAQVFAVDTWRLEDIARDLYSNNPEVQHQALLSELVYTLGVAAVLTKGDLPVYMIQRADSLVAA